MKKKIGIVCIVAAAAALLVAGYFLFLAPKAQIGSKAVTIQVVIPAKNVNRSFHYQTKQKYVSDLLKEHQADLQVTTQQSSYGDFVSGMLGITADAKKEFFNIKVNGKDATVGVSQLPVENGKTYTFTMTKL